MAFHKAVPPLQLVYLLLLLLLLLGGCATNYTTLSPETHLAYVSKGDSPAARNLPVLVTESPDDRYNLIGTATVSTDEKNNETVAVSPDQATVYHETRQWQGAKGSYTNLIYRVHFPSVPFSLLPFHLISGDNVGLFIIITFDENSQPLLVTTVHTCGCYLAFIPTTSLPEEFFPDNWQDKEQSIYGESLPAVIDYPSPDAEAKLHILFRHSTHRVKRVWMGYLDEKSYRLDAPPVLLTPLADLTHLHSASGTPLSFYETEGPRKEYVIGSQKIWERLLISWWAFDWRVGEDKRLGNDQTDGITFYTSLKPWAREESDLRNFSQFLHYWGWKF